MTAYDRNLILALEEINNAECGTRFTTTADLLDNMDDYVLYEDCNYMIDVVVKRWKDEWDFTLPEELEDFFDIDGYIEWFKMGGGEWFETEYGMVERLI